LAQAGPPLSSAAVFNPGQTAHVRAKARCELVRVKLNGTIHADAQGTYMMCGQKRVPVKLVDANGNEVKPETVKDKQDEQRATDLQQL
jgi:hypothetical protein